MEKRLKNPKVISPELIAEFDEYLANQGLKFEGVTIGGSALILLKVVQRGTKDCDVISPIIPKDIKDASVEFAKVMRGRAVELIPDWFNNGPESITKYLPKGWQDHLQTLFDGKALILCTLDRLNLLRTKIAAYCDRFDDLGDCIALRPTAQELEQVLPWVKQYDANPQWPEHVERMVKKIEEQLSLNKDRGPDYGNQAGGFGLER